MILLFTEWVAIILHSRQRIIIVIVDDDDDDARALPFRFILKSLWERSRAEKKYFQLKIQKVEKIKIWWMIKRTHRHFVELYKYETALIELNCACRMWALSDNNE